MMRQSSNTRRESRNIAGRFRGGKLAPVLAVPFRGGEGGMLSQTVTMQLDPIAGRLLTPITAEVISVFVPFQACVAILRGEESNDAITEVIKKQMLGGATYFGVNNETEITRRLGVRPVSIGGVKQVNGVVGAAYNAAINFLRRRLYTYATTVPWNNNTVTPSLYSSTILQRFNAVLDPDDHINGAVELSLPTMNLPVQGLGMAANTHVSAGSLPAVRESGRAASSTAVYPAYRHTDTPPLVVRTVGTLETLRPDVFAVFDGAKAGGVSLSDFYNAEKQDQLTRMFDQVRSENSQQGEEAVWRFVNGLTLDDEKYPFVIFEQSRIFGESYNRATDGVGMETEVSMTESATQMSFTVPVPKTELGGIVITFANVKPDETVLDQPHPILTKPWTLINAAKEEMILEPIPVTMREINGSVPQAQELTRAFYTGHNELLKAYSNYGFNAALDPTTVEAKNAIWQVAVPASVTPDSVIYPAEISQYPFLDPLAEICFYSIQSEAVVSTPSVYGPSPVETIAVIDSKNIFGDA